MKGVIYARYSSDNQREESIEGQLRECKEYAERNDITILGTYIDRALSAKTDNRPEFQHMIKDSAKGLFDVVLVWKLDRFARNRYDSARYKNILKKNGVKVISARENISEGSEGIILEAMLEGYAEYYSAELSEKVIRGLTDNALKCKYNGGTVPMGYYIDEQQYYQIDPKTAPVVLEMFTKYSEGATMQELVNLLNSRGMRSIRGGKITLNIMNHLLKNRRYMGEYSYRDVVKEDGIPTIVPKELFERVQERLAKNKKAPARHKAEDDYLLTTKLYCGKCGSFMVGESGTSHTMKVHRYYRCVNTKKKKLCDKKAVKKDWIEDLVVNYTMKAIMNDEVMERLIDTLMELQKKESTDLPLLKKQLAETEKGINNMLNAIQAGIFTPSTKQRLDELEETKSQLEVSILQEEMHKPLLTREQIAFFIYRFRKFDVTKREQRQRLIDSFVNAVYLYEDKIILTFNYKDGSKTITLAEVEGSDLSVLGAPWRVFLQHLKGCKNTRFLYSEFTGGVVDDYAFSCIYGHFRDRQGQHRWNLDRSDAVIVDAKPLLPYAVDLLRIEYFDLLNQFVQHPGRQFPRSGVLANKTDKHIRCHGTAALLLYLGAELFYFLRQLLLLVLIPPGHFCEAVIGELAGNIVLIDALKETVQFFVTGKERFQLFFLQLAVCLFRLLRMTDHRFYKLILIEAGEFR